MNSNRQSPSADAELSACDICCALDWSISAPRLLRALALVTSSSVKGLSPSDSMVFTRVSRTASILSGSHEAVEKKRPGSCALSARACAVVASFDSTSALYSRPLGDCEMMPAMRLNGAQSACEAEGMWYADADRSDGTDATKRHGALAVLGRFLGVGRGELGVSGLGIEPRYFSTRASAFASSNLPATIRTQLSGW